LAGQGGKIAGISTAVDRLRAHLVTVDKHQKTEFGRAHHRFRPRAGTWGTGLIAKRVWRDSATIDLPRQLSPHFRRVQAAIWWLADAEMGCVGDRHARWGCARAGWIGNWGE